MWSLSKNSQHFAYLYIKKIRFKCSLEKFLKVKHYVGVLSAFYACVDVVHGVSEAVSWSSCLLLSLASLSLQCDHNNTSAMRARVLKAPSK